MEKEIEKSILCLVNDFIETPFAFFTEADIVAHFRQSLISKVPALQGFYKTKDCKKVLLVHNEYNRFSVNGQYDMVILNPDFVKKYSFDEIANINKKSGVPKNGTIPLFAAFEFKFSKKGKPQTLQTVQCDIENLNNDIEKKKASHCYCILLIRECSDKIWTSKEWSNLLDTAKKKKNVRSIFIKYNSKTPEICQFGSWQIKYNQKKC